MSIKRIRSIVEDLGHVRSAVEEHDEVDDEQVDEQEDEDEESEGDDEEQVDALEDIAWVTPMGRIASNALIGSWVAQRFPSQARHRPDPNIPEGTAMESIQAFRKLTGLPLNEDTGPSKEEVEAIALLAALGEMVETDLRDMLTLDEDGVGSVVEAIYALMEDADAIEEAAQRARGRGAAQGVLEVARDPGARRIALGQLSALSEAKHYWMQAAAEKMKEKGTKGALHRALKVKAGKKIPKGKVSKLAHARIGSKAAGKTVSAKLKKRAMFAANAAKAKHEETEEEETELSERLSHLKSKLAAYSNPPVKQSTFRSLFQNEKAKGARKPHESWGA